MKNYILFILLLSFSSSSLALDLTPLFGVRWNSPESGQTGYKDTSGLGGKLGAVSRIEFTPTLSLRTGLIWNQRDYNGKVYISLLANSNVDFKQKVSYLDIPVNIQWMTPLQDTYIFGGFIYASKLSDSISYDPALISFGLEEAAGRGLTNSDTLMNMGIGYSILHLTNAKVSAEVEYEYGLTNINATPGDSGKIYQRALSINLLYNLKF